MHFFTLFGSVTNLTFTLFRNCRFCHFYTPFNWSNIGSVGHSAVFTYHSIGLSSFPPFLRTIQWAYTACGLCKKINLSDRLCHFCVPFNMSNIGSAGRNVNMNRFVSHFTNDTGLNDLLVHELMCRVLNWVVLTSRFNEHYYYVCWIWIRWYCLFCLM